MYHHPAKGIHQVHHCCGTRRKDSWQPNHRRASLPTPRKAPRESVASWQGFLAEANNEKMTPISASQFFVKLTGWSS